MLTESQGHCPANLLTPMMTFAPCTYVCRDCRLFLVMAVRRDLKALAEKVFDLLVVGGGIFGCGIARDAALRRLSVALVEKSDFGGGTTAGSSRLIHGGLRSLLWVILPLFGKH